MLQWLLHDFSDLWKILSAQDTQNKRNTHDDEDALEDISKRYLELRKSADAAVACKIQIELTPECKVQRSREYAGSCIECCERYGKLGISS